MHARTHARTHKVHQHIMTSMCGYWRVMVVTATTKSRTLATVYALTEHYVLIGLHFSINAVQEMFLKCITPEVFNCVR